MKEVVRIVNDVPMGGLRKIRIDIGGRRIRTAPLRELEQISIAAGKVLIGGGASYLGQLLNVGSWADEVPVFDRIMYQPAGSAQWVQIALKEIVGLDTAALAQYLATNRYATQPWVTERIAEHAGNGTIHITAEERTRWNSAAIDLGSILGSNADGLINKWNEIVAFLATYGEADTLAGLLSNKVDKTTRVIAGDGLAGGGPLSADVTLSLAQVVEAGNYTSVTVDIYGRVVAGKNNDTSRFDELFEKVNIGTTSAPVWAIRAKLGFFSDDFVSSKGPNADGSGAGSATTLGALVNVEDAADLKPLTDQILVRRAGSTHWSLTQLASIVGLDTEALADYLTANKYATQTWTEARYLKAEALAEYAKESWVTGKGYITQDALAGYATTTQLAAKLDASRFDELFEKVNIGTSAAPVWAIRAKLGFYSDNFISSKGPNSDGGGGAIGATTLAALNDVTLASPIIGDVLQYNGQRWVNTPMSSIKPDLAGYATQQWVKDQGYLTQHQSLANVLPYYALNGGLKAVQSITTWGNTLGSVVAEWVDASGACAFKFKKGNPSDGKISLLIDGTVYIDEGQNAVASQAWVEAKGYATQGALAGYAKLNAPNDFRHSSNEVTFASSPGNDALLWLNYRLASGSGSIAQYMLGDGTGGGLASLRARAYAVNMTADTPNYLRGLSWYNAGGSTRLGEIAYYNAGQALYLNPIAAGDPWTDAVGKYSLVVGVGRLTYNTYGVWHAGNDGAGSDLDADLLDGKHAASFAQLAYNPADLNSLDGFGFALQGANANATAAGHYPIQEAGALIYCNAAYSKSNQIYGSFSSNRWFARGGGNTSRTAWREFAFLDSTVTSASKLATSRSLWGQPFDGSADVTGSLTGVVSITSSSYYRTEGYGGASRDNGVGALSVGINNNSAQTPLLLAYRAGTWSALTGANRLFAAELLNTGTQLRFSFGGAAKFYFESDGTFHTTKGMWAADYVSSKGQNTSSDARLKTVLRPVALTMEQIAEAPAVVYAWRDGSGVDVGSIAQYWQDVLPEGVRRGRDGYLAMAYDKIALAASILTARRVLDHERRIALLERENRELKRQLKQIAA